MYELEKKYIEQLEELAAEIQESDELAKYLDTEEEEDYINLKDNFEPRIALLYREVADNHPLQLVPFELVLLESVFEGLYLPKVLGFSVLRGEVNEQYKYVRPQEHFREVLLAICNSANFDILKKRIGQSIQVGFALSSNIWVTNLINSIENKRVRYYLQAQKLERYRDAEERSRGYRRYAKQFRDENYMSAEFPETTSDLPVLFSQLRYFLLYRVRHANNKSLLPHLRAFIQNKDFIGTREYLQTLAIHTFYFADLEAEQEELPQQIQEARSQDDHFVDRWLEFVLQLHKREDTDMTPEADLRFSSVLQREPEDDLTRYYDLLETIHDEGYTNAEVHTAVKAFCGNYEGLSIINECVRRTIYRYFRIYINNLEPGEYPEYFEITKLFPVYMGIFANQQFNQDLKELSMAYVKKLLKTYTDKRGKDYQDIKKFVSTTFLDFNFLKEKQITELFKTRRKKKKSA